MPPFDREFFGGRDRLELTARSLLAMVTVLDREGPGFSEIADMRAQFAVDGVVESDWTTPLDGATEVIVLPRVGGG